MDAEMFGEEDAEKTTQFLEDEELAWPSGGETAEAPAELDELARRWRAAHSLTAPRRPPFPKTRRRVRSRR